VLPAPPRAATSWSTSSTEAVNGPLLEVGRVARPHGLAGAVVVELTTNRSERAAVGACLHGPDGQLEVTASSPSGRGRWIVRFAGVDDLARAERLRGAVLRAPAIQDPDVLWVHLMIGAAVVDVTGDPLGTVVSVEANPASDLLVLPGGRLIPLRFVTAYRAGVVTVDPPPGLLEL